MEPRLTLSPALSRSTACMAQGLVRAEDGEEFPCTFTDVCSYSEETDSDDMAGAPGLFVGSPLGNTIFAGAAAGAIGFLASSAFWAI